MDFDGIFLLVPLHLLGSLDTALDLACAAELLCITVEDFFIFAFKGYAYAEFFIKRMERGEQEPPSILLSATRLLYHMGNIFRDNAPAPAATGVQIDRKRLAQMRQKRVALGHKPDDHELEQQEGFSMKFHM